MLLRIEAPHFVAGAVFKKMPDGWRCVRCAPIIRYMKDMKPEAIKGYLAKKGWRYEWVKPVNGETAG